MINKPNLATPSYHILHNESSNKKQIKRNIKDFVKLKSGEIKELRRKSYPGSMLMTSQSSMFTAQSGPINMSLVALSAQEAALFAIAIVAPLLS